MNTQERDRAIIIDLGCEGKRGGRSSRSGVPQLRCQEMWQRWYHGQGGACVSVLVHRTCGRPQGGRGGLRNGGGEGGRSSKGSDPAEGGFLEPSFGEGGGSLCVGTSRADGIEMARDEFGNTGIASIG